MVDRLLSQGCICSLLVVAPGCIYFAAHKIRTNAVHITMILDIATSAWLIDFCHKAKYVALRLDKLFNKFYGRYQDLIEKYQRSVKGMVNDSFPG